MRKLLLPLLLAFLSNATPAAGLDDIGDIDIVRVNKESGQVHLYLVLDPDQSPLNESIKSKIRRKLQSYRYYVTSGQVWKNEAGSNPKLPVVLTVVVTGGFTSEVQAALTTLKSQFEVGPTSYAVVSQDNPVEKQR